MTAPYTTLPGGNQSPFSSTPGLPMGSSPGSNPFTTAQQMAIENAVHSDSTLGGIWDTIKNAGGDVWGVISNVLPKSADGSIDWGKVGSDVFGFIKDNASAILSALSAVNSYQRQGQADKYAQQALKLAQQSYDAKAPLRAAGQAGMLDPHAGTPNLSSLSAQGQQGKSIQAPLPLAAPQTGYQNAASVAGNNPFTKGLPLAGAPVGPGGPQGTQGPGGPPPFTPQPPTPLPLGPPGQFSPTPGVGGAPPPVPNALQMAPQSGPIANGPQNHTLPTFPSGAPQYGVSPDPNAPPVPPNRPVPPPMPHYSAFSPLPLAGS